MFSRFFIDRPIFAAVLSIFIVPSPEHPAPRPPFTLTLNRPGS